MNTTDSHELLENALKAATQAVSLIRESFAFDAGVESTVGHDIKTLADVASEACIKQILAPSGIPILAEESADGNDNWKLGQYWLVDPIDGTMNIARGFPCFSVSIGLWSDGEPVLGVVYDIAHQSMFSGIVGLGAWRDGKPIAVSNVNNQGQAILATGFPVSRNYDDAPLLDFVKRIQSFKKIRMIGSAALSLAMVAQGTFDAYCEEDIMVWDVAAGLAIVKASGGRILFSPGSSSVQLRVAATNGRFTLAV
jgi:myo-inositol-1(or 4)-monophosphatase